MTTEADNAVAPAVTETQTQDWRASLPDDLKQEKSLSSFKDVATLAKSYVHAQKSLGSRIPIPDPTNAEALNEIYTKLGRPESPDKYEIQRVEGLNYNEALESKILEQAHRLGLNHQQASELVNWTAQDHAESVAALRESTEQTLKQEWGQAYDKNIALAQRGLRAFADKELLELIDSTGLGNHPAMIRLAHSIGSALGEDSAIGSGGTGNTMTPADAKSQIGRIMADPNHLYHAQHAGKPGHKEAVAEMQRLFQMAHPQ